MAASYTTIRQHGQAVRLHETLLGAARAERMELMELEAYFRWRGQDVSGAIRVDGRYRGCTLRWLHAGCAGCWQSEVCLTACQAH